MANMSLKKTPMPTQEPEVRNRNFDEVALGYTAEAAIDECHLAKVLITNLGSLRRHRILFHCHIRHLT